MKSISERGYDDLTSVHWDSGDDGEDCLTDIASVSTEANEGGTVVSGAISSAGRIECTGSANDNVDKLTGNRPEVVEV
jgi:hypothetical protein